MKPFDHEAAASGQPFIHEVYVGEDGDVKDPKMIGKHLIGKRLNGSLVYEDQSGDITWAPAKSLRMLPTKRTVYLNIYDSINPKGNGKFAVWHNTADSAERHSDEAALAVAIPVEIEV